MGWTKLQNDADRAGDGDRVVTLGRRLEDRITEQQAIADMPIPQMIPVAPDHLSQFRSRQRLPAPQKEIRLLARQFRCESIAIFSGHRLDLFCRLRPQFIHSCAKGGGDTSGEFNPGGHLAVQDAIQMRFTDSEPLAQFALIYAPRGHHLFYRIRHVLSRFRYVYVKIEEICKYFNTCNVINY